MVEPPRFGLLNGGTKKARVTGLGLLAIFDSEVWLYWEFPPKGLAAERTNRVL
jgi:hypothetical protein